MSKDFSEILTQLFSHPASSFSSNELLISKIIFNECWVGTSEEVVRHRRTNRTPPAGVVVLSAVVWWPPSVARRHGSHHGSRSSATAGRCWWSSVGVTGVYVDEPVVDTRMYLYTEWCCVDKHNRPLDLDLYMEKTIRYRVLDRGDPERQLVLVTFEAHFMASI